MALHAPSVLSQTDALEGQRRLPLFREAAFDFDDVPISPEWAFAHAKRADTTYITHGYHRYPAKFIPQLARRLIDEHSVPGDLVLDPFCGCGTTLVEAMVTDRRSFGVDINPIAVQISKAKIQHIDPDELDKVQSDLECRFNSITAEPPDNARIAYWFKEEQMRDLAKLLVAIEEFPRVELRLFFLCAFSNILKNCSIWHQKSNKPTRDFKKQPADVMKAFARQVRMMKRGNTAFREIMHGRNLKAIAWCGDSRKLPLANESVDLMITSPPYVTSYEYADLHQLSMLWFENLQDLKAFRKEFIGSTLNEVRSVNSKRPYEPRNTLAGDIVSLLEERHARTASSVNSYFHAMYQIWFELERVLKPGAKACIVIGNTSLKGVEIRNAEVFAEQLDDLGFRICDVIKREIPSKNLPSTRDKRTGRFAKVVNADSWAYPTELILVAEKWS
ncbi:MAG: DNA methyltransferase [Chloroflexi bacterium]|nr:DNA methyltransferase [Chloroflexota bacterium]